MATQDQRDLLDASRTISRQQKQISELQQALYSVCKDASKNRRSLLAEKAKRTMREFGLDALDGVESNG